MAIETTVKTALRISNAMLDSEISLLISACKADLKASGLKVVNDTESMTQLAIIKFCKAEMNFQGNADKWRDAYKEQKIAMGLNADYNTEVTL